MSADQSFLNLLRLQRRWRIIKFHGDLLEQILRCEMGPKHERFIGLTSDAPDDLQLLGFHRQCPWDDTYEFVVGSATFDSVRMGSEIPVWTPTFQTHYGPAQEDAT